LSCVKAVPYRTPHFLAAVNQGPPHCRSGLLALSCRTWNCPQQHCAGGSHTSLLGGGGVDGAIHRAAGPELLAACRLLGGCKTGHAKLTNAYRLPARFVIHTVGPVWQGGWHNEAELLADCYRSCFTLAREHNLCTLAFPAVSCGVYGYPIAQAVEIALRETQAELGNNEIIERITFACFGDDVWLTYQSALKRIHEQN
jgi:O-acetyl-ADP-ribose deacetylase (regulator of RNase III)